MIPDVVLGGQIVNWGNNGNYHGGPWPPPAGTDFVAIARADFYSLALKADGSIVQWGYGYGTPSGNDYVVIAAGPYALKADGSIEDWGGVSAPSGNNFVAITRGRLALKANGSLIRWGSDHTVPPGNDFVAIAGGENHYLALKADGSLVEWGTTWEPTPTGNNFVAISAGAGRSLAIKADGSLVEWGINNYGVPDGNDYIAIACGTYHNLALKTNGEVVGWGSNSYDQCNPPYDNGFVAIACGGYYSIGIRAFGSLDGVVRDQATSEPIVGADASIPGQPATQTNGLGEFSFSNLPVGQTTVSVIKDGYYPATQEVSIVEDSTTFVSIELTPLPTFTLEGVVHDQVTGSPIEGAEISVVGQTPIQTNEHVEFDFDLPAGEIIVNVAKVGYYDASQTIIIGENSNTFINVIMLPKTGGSDPVIVKIEGNYCGPSKYSYYLRNVSLSEQFTVTIDWHGHTPGQVKWLLPDGIEYIDNISGNTASRTFDMGSEFAIGGKLSVVAIAADLVQSALKQANFMVISPPLGIPVASLFPNCVGNILRYSAQFELQAIKEGVDGDEIPEEIPGFGGRKFEFVTAISFKTEVTGSGTAEATIDARIRPKPMEIASVEIIPQVSGTLNWTYSSEQRQWIPGGSIGIQVQGKYTTAPSYYIIPVGPVPVPVYWRTGIEAVLGVQLALTGWYLDGSPVWAGNVPFEIGVEIMLGVGVADMLAAEGYLGGCAYMLLEFPNEEPLQQLDIELDGGIRLVALVFSYEDNLLHYEWHLAGGESMATAMIPMFQGTLSASEFTVMKRDYLDSNYAVWAPEVHRQKQESSMMLRSQTIGTGAGEPNEEQLLQSNVFSQSQPTIAADDNDLLLAWIYDDPYRTSINRTELIFSKYVNGIWSQPIAIDNNGTADFSPQITMLSNGNAFCVWENVKVSLPNDVNLTDMAAKMEIESAFYNSSTGLWTAYDITDNNHTDRSPRVAAADNNTAMVVWIYNDKDDLLCQDANALNTIKCSSWNGSSWSSPNTITTNVGLIVKTSLAYNGNKAVYVYTVDKDNVWTTVTDQDIYALFYYGNTWSEPNRITDNNSLDANPQIVYEGDYVLMVWYNDANVYSCYNFDINNARPILFTSGSSAAMDFRLAKSPSGQISLVWNENSATGIDIHTAIYDPQLSIWSKEYQLTFDLNMERSITACFAGLDELVLAYNKVEIIDHNGIPEPNRVDLYVLRHPIKGDLGLTSNDISFDVGNPLPGSTVNISAMVHNTGDIVEVNIPVAFYNGNPNNGGVLLDNIQFISGPISAGDRSITTISWSVPDVNEPQKIYVVVDPNFEKEDSDRSNNTAFVSVMSPDLAITSINSEKIGPKMRSIIARITNLGSLPVENVPISIHRETEDGPLLNSLIISELNSNSSCDVWYLWDITAQDFNDVEIPLYVISDPNNTIAELNEDDNTAFALVQVGRMADITDDGIIDFKDFAVFAIHWRETNCCYPALCGEADFSKDQEINFEDLLVLAHYWLTPVWVGTDRSCFYDFSLDRNPNWTVEGEWAFGQPTGNGGTIYGYPDPVSGYTGSNVYGVNLNGDYSTSVSGPYYLTAGPFDCSSYEDVALKFYRWLNSDYPPFVKHKIEVSNNGIDWNAVWEQNDFEEITDNTWQTKSYDISNTADGKDKVYIRWSYEVSQEGAFPMSGWNIDDIQLWGMRQN